MCWRETRISIKIPLEWHDNTRCTHVSCGKSSAPEDLFTFFDVMNWYRVCSTNYRCLFWTYVIERREEQTDELWMNESSTNFRSTTSRVDLRKRKKHTLRRFCMNMDCVGIGVVFNLNEWWLFKIMGHNLRIQRLLKAFFL